MKIKKQIIILILVFIVISGYLIYSYKRLLQKEYYYNGYKINYNKSKWQIEIGGVDKDEIFDIKKVNINFYNKNRSYFVHLFLQDKDYQNVPNAMSFGVPMEYLLSQASIYSFFNKTFFDKQLLILCDGRVSCQFYEKREDGLYWDYREALFGFSKSSLSLTLKRQPTEKEIEEVIELIEDIHNAEKVK